MAVLAGGEGGFDAEEPLELFGVGEAALGGDGFYRQVGLGEEPAGFQQAAADLGGGAVAQGVAETPFQVAARGGDGVENILDVDASPAVGGDESQGPGNQLVADGAG